MKTPALTDRVVTVRAYLTDEHFGYTHWRAAQFAAPADAKPAVLLIFDNDADRGAWLKTNSP